MIKVLFFAANPKDTTALEVAKELRAVKMAVVANGQRKVKVISSLATQADDLQPALSEYLPHVVHFSGHGSSIGEILTEDENGNIYPVSPAALRSLFTTPYNNNVRLVFLNACYSRLQAEAIIEVVDCAIGMNTAIPDRAAIVFATAVYAAIAGGLSVAEAFEQGKCRLEFADLLQQSKPELLTKKGVDAKEIQLVDGTRHAEASTPYKPPKPPENEKLPSWTNPTGRSYLSYQRSRADEARLLIAAQRERGIPTIHNLTEIDEDQTEKAIRRSIDDSGTANAIIWLTPGLRANSLRHKEVASIFARAAQAHDDNFFVHPLLAGGLVLTELRSVFNSSTLGELQEWNPRVIHTSPIGVNEAAEIARSILKKRLAAIHKSLPEGEPLRVQFFTRPPASLAPGTALLLDWVDRFESQMAKGDDWEQLLLPALRDVAEAVQTHAFERTVEVSGLVGIPAATALGCVFLAPRGLSVAWRQHTQGQDDQLWHVDLPREKSGFRYELIPVDAKAKDIAVLVSVAANLELAFNASRDDLPPLRAVVRISKPGTNRSGWLEPGQAVDVAQLVVEGLHQARTEFRKLGCVHLFLAVPVGLAMMIGQLLNTFGPIQTYEHIPDEGVGHFEPAALLHPSI